MKRADDELARWVSGVLAIGTTVAIATVALGVALTLLLGGAAGQSAVGLVAQIMALKPASIVSVGLLLLALTPAAQLVVALVAFARRGEHRYTFIASVVLSLLALGVVTASLFSRGVGG